MNKQIQHFYNFGEYKIEKTERLLTRHGEVVPLPPFPPSMPVSSMA